MSTYPADLRYTKDHEWAKVADNAITVGITAFAVEQLGDITLVTIDAKVGDEVTEGKAFGTIESVKTLSDLFAPVSGKITKINTDLDSKPELINDDCYGKGWIIEIEVGNTGALTALLAEPAYVELVKAQ